MQSAEPAAVLSHTSHRPGQPKLAREGAAWRQTREGAFGAQENLSTLFSATQPPTSTCSADTSYFEPFREKAVAHEALPPPPPGFTGIGGGGASSPVVPETPAKKRPGAVPR